MSGGEDPRPPARPRAPATRLLLLAIGLAFAAEVLAGGSTDRDVLVRFGANLAGGPAAGELWRPVTSMFLHVGLVHLLFNAWALYQLGTLYEVWMGPARLLAVYFAAGVAGSLVSAAFLPPGALSAGASGAIFGLLGALISFLFRRRDRLAPAARSLLVQLALWAGINVFLGLSVAQIDNAAHLAGFAAGLALGLFVNPRWERAASAGEA